MLGPDEVSGAAHEYVTRMSEAEAMLRSGRARRLAALVRAGLLIRTDTTRHGDGHRASGVYVARRAA
jgi:hypothetical protein